jgi:hypothetical protein
MATHYTDNELNAHGDKLAQVLNLKRLHIDANGRQRWQTDWGSKTGLGLMLSIKRVARSMDEGTLNELTP